MAAYAPGGQTWEAGQWTNDDAATLMKALQSGTALDQPPLEAAFVELEDPSGPFGNKALGEPPAISPAPAIRNAVLQATGVAFDTLPLSPQKLVEGFVKAGLLKEVGGHV